MNFYERLKQECKKNNTTVTTLLKEFNITTGRLSSWKKGGKPNPEEVKLFANKLNVSLDFLLLGKENSNSHRACISNTVTDTNEQQLENIIDIYNQLDNIGKAKLLVVADEILKNKEAR